MPHGNETNTPTQRLQENLKSPYPHKSGSNWDALIDTFASEFDELETTRGSVLASKVVNKASGAQLERLGEIVQTARETGESDPHYRGRLKVQLKKFTGGATVQEIKEVSGILLQTDESRIEIAEDFEVESARFIIRLWADDLNKEEVTATEFKEFIDEVRGAGINTLAQERGTFTYRSAQDYSTATNDPSKGYKNPSDGVQNGTYAGLL